MKPRPPIELDCECPKCGEKFKRQVEDRELVRDAKDPNGHGAAIRCDYCMERASFITMGDCERVAACTVHRERALRGDKPRYGRLNS